MVDYRNSKIYMIIGKKINKIYIGSTTYPLEHRLNGHKDDRKKWLDGYKYKKYVSSYKILESGEVQIILLENYPCDNKYQLHLRESEWISKYRPICVNLCIPGRYKKLL